MKPVIFLAFANTYSEQGQHLQQLKTELEGIRQVLDTAARYNGQFEVVERANASLANVFEVFQRHSGRIAIFHYAGHAGRNELFLEDDQGGTQAAHSAGLVPFLARSRGLQLVFFNGCSSKTQAEQLAAAGVPAVIGTSKPINDAIATRLAIRFYTGVMSGASLRDAWEDAKNELQSSTGNAVTRSLLFGEEGEQDDLIWHVCLRPDADSSEVLNWKFADALRDPLFGLPPIPPQYSFPPEPFRFLRHYEAEHARVFFGRGKAIRDLYRLVDDPEGAPVILLYGQSGVGKSSLLDAGLLPRLEHSHTVRYIRRDQALGLTRTLAAALGHTAAPGFSQSRDPELDARIAQLREIAAGADPRLRAELDQVIQRLEYQPSSLFQQTGAVSAAAIQDLRQAWLEAEAQPGGGPRPLLIILDQVEEAFTQPMPRNDPEDPASPQQELAQLMQAVRQIFGHAGHPAGKLILSYRKEYHPEVEDTMRRTQLPYTGVFLQHLDRDDIMEVVRGLASTERHRRQYRIAIEEHLPEMIANDLQADKKSAISPVLQILMTKLWLETQRDQSGKFSVRQYEALRSQGVLLDDFFQQQMEQLAAMPRFKDAVASGLALDLLFQHTSALGTSRVCTEAEIRERYPSREQEIQDLIRQLTDLFLLTNRGGGSTSLAHDTLAPLVQRAFRESDRPGQRATRILESKLDPVDDGFAGGNPPADAGQDSTQLFLDRTDLSIVEAGRSGMRDWNEAEIALYERSRRRRSRQRWTWRAIYALGGLFTLAVVILYLNAEASRIEAENQRMRAQRTSDSLSVTTESLKQTSGELILASQNLSKTNDNLKKKQDSLFIAIKLTEKAQREAAKARGEEELAKVLAEQQRDSAQRSARQAQMQSLIADLNRQQALFGEYQAKVRELAVKGLAEKDSVLKEQLALTSYQLHRHAVRRIQDTLEVLQRQLEAYQQDSSFAFLLPTVQLAGNLLDDIGRRSRQRDAPEETFAALREAWTRRWMQTGQRLPASSEALVWMGDGSFLYNDRNGALAVAIPPEDVEKGFRQTNRPAQAGYLVKSACATDGGLLLGLDDGRLLPVNSQGSPGGPVMTSLKGPVTALLWENRLNRVIVASQRNLYRIRLGEPGASAQLSELPQPLLPKELRDQFQISSLAMAETPQGMLLLAAGAGPRSGLLLALLIDQADAPAVAVKLPELPGGAAPFRLAWEPRTRQLAVGCMDGRVFLGKLSAAGGWSAWDSLSRVHRSLISALTFAGSGQRLASASADGQIALYDLLPVPRLALSFRHSSIRPSPVSVLSFDRRAQRLLYGDAYDIYGLPIVPRQLFSDLCSPQSYLKPVEQALGTIALPPLCSAQSNP